MLKKVVFILLCFFLSPGGFSQSTSNKNDWTIKKDESGIAIYTRTAANSSLKELKAVFYVKTSLSSIIALIDDRENYSQWVYKCGKSTILKKISETQEVHYQTTIVPWPLDNRDFVITTSLSQDETTKIITIKSSESPNFIPNVKGFVRIQLLEASWVLTPLKDGIVEIEYRLLVNPSGAIPAWMANLVVTEGPFNTMVNFKQWVMKPKYQAAKVSFIKEVD
jgi:hypothetical protein